MLPLPDEDTGRVEEEEEEEEDEEEEEGKKTFQKSLFLNVFVVFVNTPTRLFQDTFMIPLF